jgi:hypothetical protein
MDARWRVFVCARARACININGEAGNRIEINESYYISIEAALRTRTMRIMNHGIKNEARLN